MPDNGAKNNDSDVGKAGGGDGDPSAGCSECEMLQREFAKNPGGRPMANKGLVVAAVAGGAALALSALCLPFVTPAFRRACLPYVPATEAQVENVFRALERAGRGGNKGSGGGTLVDIGSGDGRIVLEGARRGYRAHGIELNLWLVLYSRLQARRLGLADRAAFSRRDMWKSDMSKYDNVVIFGGGDMMSDLESKLSSELSSSPDCRVVSCRFPFPGWKPALTVGSGIDTVWMYRPASNRGDSDQ